MTRVSVSGSGMAQAHLVLYRTVQYSTAQYSTVQYSTVQQADLSELRPQLGRGEGEEAHAEARHPVTVPLRPAVTLLHGATTHVIATCFAFG